MIDIIAKIVTIIICLIALYIFGYRTGTKNTKLKNLEETVKDAKKTKERQLERRSTPISAIRERMRKYLRK